MQINDKSHDTRGLIGLAAICAVCQLALAPNIAIANGHANFALVFAACYALTRGGDAAITAGFVSGLLFDLCSTGPIGLMAFILTLVSRFLGSEQRLLHGCRHVLGLEPGGRARVLARHAPHGQRRLHR